MKQFLILAALVAACSAYSRVQDDPNRANCYYEHTGGKYSNYRLTFEYQGIGYYGFMETKKNYTYLRKFDDPSIDKYEAIEWDNVPKDTKPPRDWDGSFDSLPYPKPAEDSNLYKWLLCWPLLPQEHPSGEVSILDDPDRALCQWEAQSGIEVINGKYTWIYTQKPGKLQFRTPYRMLDNAEVNMDVPPSFRKPPKDWDGRRSTLGFRIPPKGTRDYNSLLCWPYDFSLKPGHRTPADQEFVAGRR